ncbi:MAG: hypothetical protein ACKO0N_11895 [Planctomycetota bacterium]
MPADRPTNMLNPSERPLPFAGSHVFAHSGKEFSSLPGRSK